MEAEVDYNIVDYYYYPDSDLETIQEESEDDRSTIHNSRRSSFSTTSSMRREEIYSNPKLPEGHANSPNQGEIWFIFIYMYCRFFLNCHIYVWYYLNSMIMLLMKIEKLTLLFCLFFDKWIVIYVRRNKPSDNVTSLSDTLAFNP